MNNNNKNNWTLRKFWPKWDEVRGELRKPHNEELNDLYPSPSNVRMIKLRRMSLVEHVARKEERRGVHRVLVGKPEAKNYLEDPGVDGKMI